MAETEHLRKTLEHYRQQRQQKIDEIRAMELMIRQLERDLGEQPSADMAIADPDELNVVNLGRGIGKSSAVRPDEFYGMSQNDAAKIYLRKVGHAIAVNELVSALQRGGAQLGGADPARTLYVSMSRNPKKEFVWPSKDHVGLKEFYERKN